jgi:hypothetical protein
VFRNQSQWRERKLEIEEDEFGEEGVEEFGEVKGMSHRKRMLRGKSKLDEMRELISSSRQMKSTQRR